MAQKIANNANLSYTFAPKGYIPFGYFLQNFAWGREPQDRTDLRNFNVVVLKLWPYGTKNRQKWYFLEKFAPREKFWGSIGKLEHRCTTTCNDTIIVLKIILLHIVSVITNFVIPKRDKKNRQTKKQTKKSSHFFVYSRRATQDPHHTWHGYTGRPTHFLHPLTFLIRAVISPLGAIENVWENALTAGKCL